MKKSFMTRALAMGLSLAMAFSLSAATNVSVASAASKPAMASKQFAVRVGGAAKSYKASAATQKSYKITKATVGNTDKATVKVNSSKKSIKVTPGTVTGTTVVTVTFKNIKTAKSTAKKYRCVVKAAIEQEPEKPTEPEVVKATKITSVTPTAADTLEVKFDAPVADATKAVKLDRAGAAVEVTANWSDTKDTVILTGKTAFAAGTYTVTYEEFTESCVVSARKATSIEVLTSKIALGSNLGTEQRVYFNVLDQYGKAMDYSSQRMTITATNVSKGLNMSPTPNSTTKNPYFTVYTNASSMAIGDSVAVVIALTSDPTVIKTANLTIDNIYTDSFEFGDLDLAGDLHVFMNQGSKYSIKYTAVDTEGKDVLLSYTRGNLGNYGSTVNYPVTNNRTINNITFVSSNESIINPTKMKIDANGKLYFTTENFAGKVTLTAVNNVTGKTSKIDLQVGDSSKATKLDIADVTIARANYGTTGSTIAKADVVVYDQYGDVMKAADVAKLQLSTLFTITPGYGSLTADISDDGKYVVYKVANNNFNTTPCTYGVTYNVNFVSTTDAGVTSVGRLTIGEDTAMATIQENAAPDDVVIAGGKIKIKVKVLDNYNNAKSIASTVTSAGVTRAAISSLGHISVEDPGQIVSATSISRTVNDIATIELETKAIGESYKNGAVRLVLTDRYGEEVDSKSYNVIISNKATGFDVSTDKLVYGSGETVKVTVKAMNGSTFLSKYKTTIPVTITGAGMSQTFNKTLAFENGTATFDIPAYSGTTYIQVKKADETGVKGSNSTAITVDPATAPVSFSITTGGVITAKDNAGNVVTDFKGLKLANVKVTNAAGADVTGAFCTVTGASISVDSDGNIPLNFTSGTVTLPNIDFDNVSKNLSKNITPGFYLVTIKVGNVSGSITVEIQ